MFFEKVANKLFAILSEEGSQEEFNLYIGIFLCFFHLTRLMVLMHVKNKLLCRNLCMGFCGR